MFDSEQIFLGRQPIVDGDLNTYAFELLFRATGRNSAYIKDDLQACIHVLVSTFSQFGAHEVLGSHKGFVNLSYQMLMSDAIGLLPKDRIILELLESVEVTDEVVSRCRDLKERGFSLALDDNIFEERYIPLYEIVDIVKVDLMAVPDGELPAHVAKLKQWPVVLLAEKVETTEMFDLCRSLGFTLFQGYFFAKPAVLQQRRLTIRSSVSIKLMNLLIGDDNLDAVERLARTDPALTYQLVKLANSVSPDFPNGLRSIRQALCLIGADYLRKWAYMNLYIANDIAAGAAVEAEALFRAKFMELLAEHCLAPNSPTDLPEAAFFAGMISGLGPLTGLTAAAIARDSHLCGDIISAFVDREGPLGSLLTLADAVDADDGAQLNKILYRFKLTLRDILKLQSNAMQWVLRVS